MVSTKEDRLAYWVSVCNDCALNRVHKRLLAYNTGKDTKVYNMSKKQIEQSRDKVKNLRIQDTEISYSTLTSPMFIFRVKEHRSRYATLKTREKFWEEYTEFQKFEYRHMTPVPWRTKDGIQIPEMTEAIAEIVLVYIYWQCTAMEQRKRHVASEHGRKWNREGSVSKSVRVQLDKCLGLLRGEGWYF